MCYRVLMKAVPGATLATFNGVSFTQISFDSRCERTVSADPVTGIMFMSFANSSKPGVVVTAPHGKIDTHEFTDTVPAFTLCIDYVDPEAPDVADPA